MIGEVRNDSRRDRSYPCLMKGRTYRQKFGNAICSIPGAATAFGICDSMIGYVDFQSAHYRTLESNANVWRKECLPDSPACD